MIDARVGKRAKFRVDVPPAENDANGRRKTTYDRGDPEGGIDCAWERERDAGNRGSIPVEILFGEASIRRSISVGGAESR